jgi:PadR family transcriptional regulator PadR
MEKLKLGNLEELVLLIVALLYDRAYSVAIVEEYKKQTNKNINISAIHNVLYRLEEKGFLESRMGETSGIRGGKRKRLFYLTAFGKKAIDEQETMREQIRKQIPEIAYKWN